MEITYRKLGSGDMDTFIKMRIQQLQEDGAEPVLDLSSELRSYYTRHLEDQTFFGLAGGG